MSHLAVPQRELERLLLARMESRNHFLKNPRFFPPNTPYGGKSLLFPPKKPVLMGDFQGGDLEQRWVFPDLDLSERRTCGSKPRMSRVWSGLLGVGGGGGGGRDVSSRTEQGFRASGLPMDLAFRHPPEAWVCSFLTCQGSEGSGVSAGPLLPSEQSWSVAMCSSVALLCLGK